MATNNFHYSMYVTIILIICVTHRVFMATIIFHYVTIILIIFVTVVLIISVIIQNITLAHYGKKTKIDICVGIHSSNHANRQLHHRGFKFPATNRRINSIWDHQSVRVSSHCRAGHHRTFRTVITDVFKPSGAHGWTKLIAQIIN
jgi:hypothetical protein